MSHQSSIEEVLMNAVKDTHLAIYSIHVGIQSFSPQIVMGLRVEGAVRSECPGEVTKESFVLPSDSN